MDYHVYFSQILVSGWKVYIDALARAKAFSKNDEYASWIFLKSTNKLQHFDHASCFLEKKQNRTEQNL